MAKFYSFLLLKLLVEVGAINGGTPRVIPSNGWKAFEVITEGDNLSGWALPCCFDGTGAYAIDATTMRIFINHETNNTASVSRIDVDIPSFRAVIDSLMSRGTTGDIRFVRDAQLAYSKWSDNGGASFQAISSHLETSFSMFCSAQYYAPNTYGT